MANKQILIGLLLFNFIIPTNNCAQTQDNLTLKFKDGSQTVSLINTLDRITFSRGNVILKKTDSSLISFVFTNIDRLSFGVFSGLPETFKDETSIRVYPIPATNFIMLKNLPEGEVNIQIFRLDGVVLMNKKLSDSTQQIDISNFANGLYLLKVNNKTLKFTKQ